ncbi:MAG TPA: hypothetical protein VFY92_00455 [Hyphomicrobiaceae bacterium]|nr:hypothetical protein [Hyphomicrobiaceae bacterium]
MSFAGGFAEHLVVTLVVGVLLAGCTGPNQPSNFFGGLLGPPPEATTARRPASVGSTSAAPPPRGSCSGAAECKRVLKAMIESPDHGWIGQQQSPDVYANGTRLFAYRALRKQLTCNELGMAVDELQSVSRTLDGGGASGMPPDQITRTRSLSSQVHSELAKERQRRCRT